MISARVVWILASLWTAGIAAADEPKPLRVAAIVTEYRRNSHADVIVGRLLDGFDLDGRGEFPKLQLVSLFTDQVPSNDLSRALAKRHGFRIEESVAEALTLGGDELAVDAVLLVAEHGRYPKSATGQTVYPKRRLFGEIVRVFEKSGRVVPVFSDKHLADNWDDAKWLYDTARRLQIPLMAGSSIPSLWRHPAIDVKRHAQLKEIVAVSYGGLDAYGFHALEMVQCLAERRRGGETGVKRVRAYLGEDVWQAGRDGVFDDALFREALGRLRRPRFESVDEIPELVKQPALFVIDYRDGLRASVLTLNGAVGEWASAWRVDGDDEIRSTRFEVQNERPFGHFTHLLKGVEAMFHTGRPTWPVERTLLTSGTLSALHVSMQRGRAVATPQLDVRYRTRWNWRQPAPPPKPLAP